MVTGERETANNLQQSWRFDWEPPKAVLRDVRTIDWIFGLLRSSAPSCWSASSWFLMWARITSSSRPTVVTKYPRAQNLWPRKFRILRSTFCAIHIELFPFMYPMICATEYLGGIDEGSWRFPKETS